MRVKNIIGSFTLFGAIWCIVIAALTPGPQWLIAAGGGALCVVTAHLLGGGEEK